MGSFWNNAQSADRSLASPSAKIEADSRAIVNGPRSVQKRVRHSGMRHLAKTSDVQVHTGESQDSGSFYSPPRKCRLWVDRCSGPSHRTPVPPQRWHFTTLSPFFSRPLPSQFLHFCFFLMLGPFSLAMRSSKPWVRDAIHCHSTNDGYRGILLYIQRRRAMVDPQHAHGF